jgi:hypothetical protein
MTDPHAELCRLQSVCPRAEIWTEGGQPVAYLPDLKISKAGHGSRIVDALLWPHPRDSYTSRLLVSEQIPWAHGGGVWTNCMAQGRSWHAYSWRGVPAELPWIEILANHMGAFQ